MKDRDVLLSWITEWNFIKIPADKNLADHLTDYLISKGVVIPVRCTDCKYFTEGMAIGMCKRVPDKPIIPMVYNNYCGFGERKEE